MNSSSSKASVSFLLIASLLLVLLSFLFQGSESQTPDNGLSSTFYENTCSDLESIVRTQLQQEFQTDIGMAAALLRIHFHDCFVLGCEGSLLLDNTTTEVSEKNSAPNLTLRPRAFEIINDIRRQVHEQCGSIVSCSDITALAARDAVFLSGGPDYAVPLGRRDGTSIASDEVVRANIPPPFNATGVTLDFFARKGLDLTDTVALSGAHTIGIATCGTFRNRLFDTPQDFSMDQNLAATLRALCPEPTAPNATNLDGLTPNTFDNGYYINLVLRRGILTSDQDLFTDARTWQLVLNYASNQTLFFEQFANSMIKMGQLEVLTGSDGEIRTDCSRRNSDNLLSLTSAVVARGGRALGLARARK